MTKIDFQHLLDVCCGTLTHEGRTLGFVSASQFENRVRHILDELTRGENELQVDFDSPPQGFPDIALGEFGVEVKFTMADTWKSIANSIQESHRVPGVRYIYIVFGKMGGKPEVRWADYADSVTHVRTSHVPRFEVDLSPSREDASLFASFGISYDDFIRLDMQGKMRYVREYAKQKHPGERLWWIAPSIEETHALPANIRLYTNLSQQEKIQYRAEAVLLCPGVLRSGRARNKYDDVVMFLLSYHGVLCHQARDLFSAGSVANPDNDDKGGLYIQRAIMLLENSMVRAAETLSDALFVEYWGESVPSGVPRLKRWLQKADAVATGWKPSSCLFKDLFHCV